MMLCWIYFYPLYWLGQFLYFALSAMINVLLGDQLTSFKVGFYLVFATSAWQGLAPNSVLEGLVAPYHRDLIVLAFLLLFVLWRRWRPITALGMVLFALAPLHMHIAVLERLVHGHNSPPRSWLGLIAYLLLLIPGLRSLAISFGRSFWDRVVAVCITFILPLCFLLHFSGSLLGPSSFVFLLIVVAACPIVSLTPSRNAPRRLSRGRWKLAVAGVAASICLPFAVQAYRSHAVKRIEAEHARVMASFPSPAAGSEYQRLFFHKGVTFSAEVGAPYHTDKARATLRLLPRYGIDAIALVPYGVKKHKPLGISVPPQEWTLSTDNGIEELSALARSIGLKVFLKPQVSGAASVRLEGFGERERWFAQYLAFIEHYARLANRIHADLFCVGVEYEQISRFQNEWRQIIRRVRSVYPGPLVYAANFGTEFENLEFWDELDYIGLDNYYPLPDDLSTEDVVRRVERVQEKFKRPIIFTEVGFPSGEKPNREPWSEGFHGYAPREQALCYEAVFKAFYGKPWFQGMYWWKIGSDSSGYVRSPESSTLSPWMRPAMDVLAKWYLADASQ